MRVFVLSIIVAAGCAASPPPASSTASSSGACAEGDAWTRGHWYESGRFVDRTMWSCDGQFRTSPPRAIAVTHDLAGGYVVPPFAEGHNHWLEPAAVAAYNSHYLADGVFYLKDQANAPATRVALDAALNRPDTVDFVSANQGFTGPGGHPLQIAKQFLAFGSFPRGWTEADLADNVVFVVTSDGDVARAWPRFVAGKPDFVKLFLLYSDEYASRLRDPSTLYHRGIDPTLVAPIVARAHAAGLRVSAHIYDAADFRNAVAGGVDDIAHFPGTGWDPKIGVARFRITDEDARAAAARKVTVMTTLSWLGELSGSEQKQVLDEVVRPNLARLRAAKVTLLIGSDQFRQSPAVEAATLIRFGLMTPAELLEAWSVTTPQAIFPRRRIGRLDDGYEASFLVLDGDPTRDFAATTRIRMQVKGGRILRPVVVDYPKLPD